MPSRQVRKITYRVRATKLRLTGYHGVIFREGPVDDKCVEVVVHETKRGFPSPEEAVQAALVWAASQRVPLTVDPTPAPPPKPQQKPLPVPEGGWKYTQENRTMTKYRLRCKTTHRWLTDHTFEFMTSALIFGHRRGLENFEAVPV